MTNPYVAPHARLRDGPAATQSPHSRPLWLGLLASAFAPALIMSVVMAAFSPWTSGSVVSVAAVGAVGVAVSLLPAVTLGLPAVLFLRRIGKLQAAWVCLAAMLAGALFGATLLGLSTVLDSEAQPIAGVLLRGLLIGSGFGLASGLAMAVGAGIPFRKPRR